MFRTPVRKLAQLQGEGSVRTVRLGEARQSAILYRVEDVDRALLAMATGRTATAAEVSGHAGC